MLASFRLSETSMIDNMHEYGVPVQCFHSKVIIIDLGMSQPSADNQHSFLNLQRNAGKTERQSNVLTKSVSSFYCQVMLLHLKNIRFSPLPIVVSDIVRIETQDHLIEMQSFFHDNTTRNLKIV